MKKCFFFITTIVLATGLAACVDEKDDARTAQIRMA